MAKGKMPPQLLEYFKNKNKKKEDGSGEKMSDKEKRKEALEKARDAKNKKLSDGDLNLIKYIGEDKGYKAANNKVFIGREGLICNV